MNLCGQLESPVASHREKSQTLLSGDYPALTISDRFIYNLPMHCISFLSLYFLGVSELLLSLPYLGIETKTNKEEKQDEAFLRSTDNENCIHTIKPQMNTLHINCTICLFNRMPPVVITDWYSAF